MVLLERSQSIHRSQVRQYQSHQFLTSLVVVVVVVVVVVQKQVGHTPVSSRPRYGVSRNLSGDYCSSSVERKDGLLALVY